MKLVTYTSESGPRAGVLTENELFDAWEMLGEPGRFGLRDLIAAARLEELAAAADSVTPESEAAVALNRDGETGLLAPIPDPDKIICIGLNYRAHAEETGQEIPKAPTIFAKYRNALVGDGATVTLPEAGKKVDYEAEIAFVISKRAASVAVEDALDHVAGYTLLNDLSARDLQGLTLQWMPGKVFDGAAPCGPALVTPDEAGTHNDLGIKLTLNGKAMQDSSTADLIFPVPELITWLSSWMTLEPGDIISTGTPSGVGMAQKPRLWLQDGDVVTVSSPTLGELTTTIAR